MQQNFGRFNSAEKTISQQSAAFEVENFVTSRENPIILSDEAFKSKDLESENYSR